MLLFFCRRICCTDDYFTSYQDNIRKKVPFRTVLIGAILEHDFGLNFNDAENKCRTKFLAVIDNRDVDVMDEMMSIFNEAAGIHERDIPDNEVDDTRKALHNLRLRKKSKHEYMYDDVDVMAAGRFEEEFCKF